MKNDTNIKSYLLLVIATIGWGASWPIAKILVSLAPPFTIGFFRFLVAVFCFLPIWMIYYRPLHYSWKTVKFFILMGLTGIFGYGVFFFTGLNYTTAAQGAIIAGVNPLTVSIVAHLMFKEKLQQSWQYFGFVVSFVGIFFVIGIQSVLEFRLDYLIGNILILFAMGCWGLYTGLSKKSMEDNSPFEVTAGAIFCGMILFAFGAVFEGFWALAAMTSVTFWVGIILLGVVVTFISFSFYSIAINDLGATRSSIFINLVPVFGTIFSVIFLHEEIYVTFIIGLLLVILGILLINLDYNNKSEKKDRIFNPLKK
ncbi:MAG: DMT family transporter [Candidatus Hodarchaeales archaeon]